MEIQIKRKNVYGKEMIYVCNEPARSNIEILTGKRTIDQKDLIALRALGHTIYDCDEEIKKLMGKTNV